VTARWIAEGLQDVPISITTLRNKDLQWAGITKTEDLQFKTPGRQRWADLPPCGSRVRGCNDPRLCACAWWHSHRFSASRSRPIGPTCTWPMYSSPIYACIPSRRTRRPRSTCSPRCRRAAGCLAFSCVCNLVHLGLRLALVGAFTDCALRNDTRLGSSLLLLSITIELFAMILLVSALGPMRPDMREIVRLQVEAKAMPTVNTTAELQWS
jgi:hypothetical protein